MKFHRTGGLRVQSTAPVKVSRIFRNPGTETRNPAKILVSLLGTLSLLVLFFAGFYYNNYQKHVLAEKSGSDILQQYQQGLNRLLDVWDVKMSRMTKEDILNRVLAFATPIRGKLDEISTRVREFKKMSPFEQKHRDKKGFVQTSLQVLDTIRDKEFVPFVDELNEMIISENRAIDKAQWRLIQKEEEWRGLTSPTKIALLKQDGIYLRPICNCVEDKDEDSYLEMLHESMSYGDVRKEIRLGGEIMLSISQLFWKREVIEEEIANFISRASKKSTISVGSFLENVFQSRQLSRKMLEEISTRPGSMSKEDNDKFELITRHSNVTNEIRTTVDTFGSQLEKANHLGLMLWRKLEKETAHYDEYMKNPEAYYAIVADNIYHTLINIRKEVRNL